MRKRCVFFSIFLLVLLASCGFTSTGARSSVKKPTVLQVLRVNLISDNHYLPFPSHTITDQHAIQSLYDAAYALSTQRGPHTLSCPLDLGLEYHLRFSQGNTIMREMVLRPQGCSSIQIGKNDERPLTKSFLQIFEQTTGISEAQLNPHPIESGNN